MHVHSAARLIVRRPRFPNSTRSCYSTKPPEPRAYRPSTPSTPPRSAVKPAEVPASSEPMSLGSILWPFGRRNTGAQRPAEVKAEPKDIARGIEASRQVILEGKLPQRYKASARRITAVICALPFALYIPYELWQRRFLGKEQKKFAQPTNTEEQDERLDTT